MSQDNPNPQTESDPEPVVRGVYQTPQQIADSQMSDLIERQHADMVELLSQIELGSTVGSKEFRTGLRRIGMLSRVHLRQFRNFYRYWRRQVRAISSYPSCPDV